MSFADFCDASGGTRAPSCEIGGTVGGGGSVGECDFFPMNVKSNIEFINGFEELTQNDKAMIQV